MTLRTRRRGRTTAILAGLACVALMVSGCSFDIGGIVQDKVGGFLEEAGIDADISFSNGPSCLPAWVTHPDEDAANQGWRSPEGEVCVSSWPEISADVDIDQQLPAALDDADIAMIVQALIPMMTGQIPGGVSGILLGEAEGYMDDLGEQLEKLGIEFTAYGDHDRLLLVISGGEDPPPGMMSLSMGVFCTVTC